MLEAAVVRLAERDRASERPAPRPTDNPYYQDSLLRRPDRESELRQRNRVRA